MINIFRIVNYRYKQFLRTKEVELKIMDDIISYKTDMLRHMLHIAITNNNELSNGEVLKLSKRLDKAIVAAYKEQLNTNNE